MIKIKGYEKIDKKEVHTKANIYRIGLKQPNPYENDREGFIIYSFTLRGITTPQNIDGLIVIRKGEGLNNCEISLTNRIRTSEFTGNVSDINNMDSFLNILETTAQRLEENTFYTTYNSPNPNI
jgi:hypothetical protein